MSIEQLVRLAHFLGLAMGFSVSFSGIVVGAMMANATGEAREALRRVPSRMSKIGAFGLVFIWCSGIYMIRPMWDGIGNLPWPLQAKLACVVLLTLSVAAIFLFERQADKGSAIARARLPALGKVATLFALGALIFAVLAFR